MIRLADPARHKRRFGHFAWKLLLPIALLLLAGLFLLRGPVTLAIYESYWQRE